MGKRHRACYIWYLRSLMGNRPNIYLFTFSPGNKGSAPAVKFPCHGRTNIISFTVKGTELRNAGLGPVSVISYDLTSKF